MKGTSTPGDRCAWCDAPATTTVLVEAGRTATLSGDRKLVDLPLYASACARHAAVGGGPDPDREIRRTATDAEQLNILDAAPTDAIRGIE